MNKIPAYMLAILWFGLIVICVITGYGQFQVNRLNMKILKVYEQKSEVPPIFKNVHDSLNREIAIAESLSKVIARPFPIHNSKTNWLFIRLAAIILALITIGLIWISYRQNTRE